LEGCLLFFSTKFLLFIATCALVLAKNNFSAITRTRLVSGPS
jgi:hypothetical protein